jgi:hypothetical protein
MDGGVTIPGSTGLWSKIKSLIQIGQDWTGKAFNAQDKTVEVRLIFFVAGAILSMVLLSLEFYYTKRINTMAFASFCGLIGLGSVSMMGRG